MVNFSFAYLGFTTFEQVDRLTIPEYFALIKAHKRQVVESEYQMAKLAWLTEAASPRKKNGRMHYDKFEKFFDREAAEAEIEGRKPMSNTARKIVEYRKIKRNKKKGGSDENEQRTA